MTNTRIVTMAEIQANGGRLDAEHYIDNRIGHPYEPHTECWYCGETFAPDDARAEIWNKREEAEPHISGGFRRTEPTPSRLVHAEPCGTKLLRAGWEIA